jgi:hypothetical protein
MLDCFSHANDQAHSIAGYDSTAQTIAFTMWELAKHPEIQERLRKEVAPYQDQELNVDDIGNLEYLDAVCTETYVLHTPTVILINEYIVSLRLYPAVPVLERVAMKDDILPLGKPIETPNGPVNRIPIQAGQVLYLLNCAFAGWA